MAALLAGFSPWSESGSAYAGFGFNDNVVLSHSGEERSGFAHGGFDAIVVHLPRHQVDDFSFYVSGDGKRYFTSDTVTHEAEAVAVAEWRYHTGETFKFSLDLKGYYFDKIFDVSETEVRRLVVDLKAAGARFWPTIHWDVRSWLWIEGQGTGERETFDDGFSNSRVGEGTLRVGMLPRGRFEAVLTGNERSRDYDHRAQYSAAGRELDDTRLKILEREGELRINAKWDDLGRWKTATCFGVLRQTDNGSGYFNYRQRSISHELTWHTRDWTVHVEGAARRLDFEVQSVGLGVFPPPRVKDVFSAQLRVERKLSEHWMALAEYNWERSRCNDPIASYILNEGLLGAQWSWEK